MPATNIRYVDPNSTAGGDGTTNALSGTNRAYVSLNAWEAARQADLVAGDIIERVICSSDDAGSTHAADTTAVVTDGWTTSATCYITIEAASSHGGKWNNAIYRLAVGHNMGAVIVESFVRISGLQIEVTPTYATTKHCINITSATAGTYYLSKNILRDGSVGYALGACIYIDYVTGVVPRTVYSWNNLLMDYINGSGRGFSVGDTDSAGYLFNNTFHNCAIGMRAETGTYIGINNLFYGCPTAASGTWAAGTDYNATDNASMGYTVTGGGNTHDRVSQTFTFADEGAGDFHLASTDAGARDYGVSDPGSGLFSDDIDGVARTGTWDIGADEYVAAALDGGPAAAVAAAVDPGVQIGGGGTTVDLTAVPAAALPEGINPAVVLGAISLDPGNAPATPEVINPLVGLGALSLDVGMAPAVGAAVDPFVLLGPVFVTAATADALAEGSSPAVILGLIAVDLSALPSAAVGGAVDPTVPGGGISVDLASYPSQAASAAVDPTVLLGAIVFGPEVAQSLSGAVDPVIVMGPVVVDAGFLAAVAAAVNPTVQVGGILVDLATLPAAATPSLLDPGVALGAVVLTVAQAEAIASGVDPQTVLGPIIVMPGAAEALSSAEGPTAVLLGTVIVSDAVAAAVAAAIDPTVIGGIVIIFSVDEVYKIPALARSYRILKLGRTVKLPAMKRKYGRGDSR